VVAARVGGLQTLVDDGRTGFLVDSRDPHAYAAAIDSVLRDPDLAAVMGRRRGRAFPALRLVVHGGAAAASVRRPDGPFARLVRVIA